MRVFQVPESEREIIKKMGAETPQDLYAFCRSCSRLMENKGKAIQLLRGTMISQLRAAGVATSVAEKVVDKFCNKLLAATPETPRS
jgi:hypothetical protein